MYPAVRTAAASGGSKVYVPNSSGAPTSPAALLANKQFYTSHRRALVVKACLLVSMAVSTGAAPPHQSVQAPCANITRINESGSSPYWANRPEEFARELLRCFGLLQQPMIIDEPTGGGRATARRRLGACSPGTYSTTSTAAAGTNCTACPAGRSDHDSDSSTACADCTAGKYSNATGVVGECQGSCPAPSPAPAPEPEPAPGTTGKANYTKPSSAPNQIVAAANAIIVNGTYLQINAAAGVQANVLTFADQVYGADEGKSNAGKMFWVANQDDDDAVLSWAAVEPPWWAIKLAANPTTPSHGGKTMVCPAKSTCGFENDGCIFSKVFHEAIANRRRLEFSCTSDQAVGASSQNACCASCPSDRWSSLYPCKSTCSVAGDCGCTDPIADNYLSTATREDGSCKYTINCDKAVKTVTQSSKTFLGVSNRAACVSFATATLCSFPLISWCKALLYLAELQHYS